MGAPTSSGGSSSEEEEDTKWKEAIESIAAITTFGGKVFGSTLNASTNRSTGNTQDDGDQTLNPPKPKHYQIKAQKLLDQIIGKTLTVVRDDIEVTDDDSLANDGGVKLFKCSSPGIVFDYADEIQRPRKRPRILPGEDIDEKSKKFRRRLRSVAVDGPDIIAAARDASQKSLARLEAKEAAAKAKTEKEEERIAELKKIRGEKWLPSIAREMVLNKLSRQHV